MHWIGRHIIPELPSHLNWELTKICVYAFLHMLHRIITQSNYLYISHNICMYSIMGGWVAIVRPLSAAIRSLSPLALSGSVHTALNIAYHIPIAIEDRGVLYLYTRQHRHGIILCSMFVILSVKFCSLFGYQIE